MTRPTEDVETSPYLVTCHTEGCENAEIAIPVRLSGPDALVVCGPCSQPITDITGVGP